MYEEMGTNVAGLGCAGYDCALPGGVCAAGAWDAVRCGTTLLFDHHSSLTAVGESVSLVVYRGGKTLAVKVQVGKRDDFEPE